MSDLVGLLAFEMFKMLSRYHNIDGRHREAKEFKKLFKIVIFEELKNTSNKNAIRHVKLLIYIYIYIEPFTRIGTYKQLRYVVLPALQKDYVRIEREKQKST